VARVMWCSPARALDRLNVHDAFERAISDELVPSPAECLTSDLDEEDPGAVDGTDNTEQ
jgi:hypothetical protein